MIMFGLALVLTAIIIGVQKIGPLWVSLLMGVVGGGLIVSADMR